jgi:DNA polymerase III delta subunit
MIYFLHGKDTEKSRQKLNELLHFFRSKDNDVSIFKFDEYDFEKEKIDELSRSGTLFGGKVVVVFNRIFDDKNISKIILENLDAYASSKNIFILYEEEIDDKFFDLIKEKAKKVQKFNLPVSKEPKVGRFGGKEYGGYNPFLVCDAVGEKNKKKAWLVFQEALLAGVPAEEVFWKVWWQTKNLLLIKTLAEGGVKSLEKESGLHPFVVKKNIGFSKNFSFKELDDFSWKLVELYHNARRGLADFEIGLEKILINV